MKLRDLRRLARSAKRPNIEEPTLPTPAALERDANVSGQRPQQVRAHVALIGPAGEEVTYAGYKRVAVTLRNVDGLFTNTERLDFPAATSLAAVAALLVATESDESFKIKLREVIHVPTGEQPFFVPGAIKLAQLVERAEGA